MHQHHPPLRKTNNEAAELKTLLNTLLPADDVYMPVVKEAEQFNQLLSLHDKVNDESFHFVFNCVSCQLEHVHNVEKWLGYSDREFTVNQYLNCVHPAQSIQFNMIARCIYKILCKGVFRLRFSSQRYISLVALKNYQNEYVVFKKTTSVFQYDNKNRLLAQLNEFTKMENYDGTPLKPRVTEKEELQREDFETLVFDMVLKNFMEKKYFSENEFQVLQQYALNTTISSNQLAALLNISSLTVDTYNKRILEKARNTFSYPFNNAKEVALYLRSERILK